MKKEGLIKSIRKGDLELQHRRIRDEFGMLKDCFEFIRHGDGFTKHYPFIAPIKINDFDREADISDTTTDYTREEYEQMFETCKHKFYA